MTYHIKKEDFIPIGTPSNVTPSTPIKVQPSGQMTPSSSISKSRHTKENIYSNVQQTPSQIRTLGVGPSSPHSISDMWNPILASLRRQKIRSLRDSYDQNEDDNSAGLNSVFALYSHVDDPIFYFEDVIKDE